MDPVISLLNDEFKNLSVYPNKGYIQKILEIVEVDLKDIKVGKKISYIGRKKNTFFGRKEKTFFGRKEMNVFNDKGISKKGI